MRRGSSATARTIERMLDVVRRHGVYSRRQSDGRIEPRILEALANVPHHEFVSANLRNLAYDDGQSVYVRSSLSGWALNSRKHDYQRAA